MMNRIGKSIDVFGATLTRRQFVKTGGMLAVGVSMFGSSPLRGQAPHATVAKNSLDPALPGSWIEIHPDNTVLIRTGKNDFGQGSIYTAYRQIVAEELSMPFEAITTVVAGSTQAIRGSRIQPGGGAGFSAWHRTLPSWSTTSR